MLYSRRGHPYLLELAQGYALGLTDRAERLGQAAQMSPLTRFDADVVVLDFLRHLILDGLPHAAINRLKAPDETGISEGNHHVIPLPYRATETEPAR